MKKFSSTMKASSRQASRKRKIRNLVFVGFVCLFTIYVVPRMIGGVSSFVYAPISYFETWLFESGSTLPNYFRDRAKLDREIDALERELANSWSTDHTIERLRQENVELRHMLGDTEEVRIAAAVVGRPTVTPYDVLVLDKGEKDGVKQYAPVYIGVDQAIGYVAEVFQNTSIVTLASTPDFESTVYIFGPNIYTTAVGIGGGVLQVSVPQGILLSVGDLVVVPSFDSGVYGMIDVVDSVPSEPSQRGYVTLSTPMQSLRYVSIGSSALRPLSFDEAVAVVENTKSDLARVEVPFGVLVDVATATTTASTASTTPDTEE